MRNSCLIVPTKGTKFFLELKKKFGHHMAVELYYKANHPKFIADHKDTLVLDGEGMPSVESFLNVPYIQQFIGKEKMLNSLNKGSKQYDDTSDNYKMLLGEAYQFNKNNSMNKDYVAVVERDGDNIKVKYSEKSQEKLDKFNDQYSTYHLNEKLVGILGDIGIKVGDLTNAEVSAGRVGATTFDSAKLLARDFSGLVRVANNMEGYHAISEEFSHLVIGVSINDPLVQRALNSLKGQEEALREILGDEYEDTVSFQEGDMDKVAEEALGKLLQRHLAGKQWEAPRKNLIQRALAWIIGKFKKYKATDFEKAILEADSFTANLAKDILSGGRKLTEEEVVHANRDATFNALSSRIERDIKILNEAMDTIAKKAKIGMLESKAAGYKIANLDKYTKEGMDVRIGILKYASDALEHLTKIDSKFDENISKADSTKFKYMRNIKSTLDSYVPFIKSLREAVVEEESKDDNEWKEPITINGQEIDVKSIIKELDDIADNLAVKYNKAAYEHFIEFLRPFLGQNIKVPFGKDKGKVISIDELIKRAPGDISFMDMWLDSMADSADTMLQLFASVVQKANDAARENSIQFIHRVQALMLEAKKRGIKDFEFMFEKDSKGNKTGNYISRVDHAKFKEDLKAFQESLDEKYGKNTTGEVAKAKLQEEIAWRKIYAKSIYGEPKPNPAHYKNKAFLNLTPDQEYIRNQYMELKAELEEKLPSNRTDALRAIQIRKDRTQRLLDSGSMEGLIGNLKGMIEEEFLTTSDDDQLFGDTTTSGLAYFDKTPFNRLPLLYQNRLKDPNELSTDIFGALTAYAYMACKYEQVEKVVDPLEVGRDLMRRRETQMAEGGLLHQEKFTFAGREVENPIRMTETNIMKRLDAFFNSQVYGKYLKDSGAFRIGDKKINNNKLVSHILKMSSLAQLGFNYLANTANITTGIAMQNIEAVAGEHFNAKELAMADKVYASELMHYVPELGNRVKKSKLALFDEFFNIRQDYNKEVKKSQVSNLLRRMFGETIAYLGQAAGDHWLYNRTAIAMAMRKKVLLDGKEMSLWDALKPVDAGVDNSKIMKLNTEDIKELNGDPLDMSQFSRRVAHINHGLFGIYNDEDSSVANRTIVGRLILQYRKWIKPQMNKRFMAAQYSNVMDQYEEGYYRTVARIVNELIRGKVQWAALKNELTDHEKRNITRVITEMAQLFALWLLVGFVDWDDDDDSWAAKYAEATARRLLHELGGLAPSPLMLSEQFKNFKSPIPSATCIERFIDLIMSTCSSDWVEEVETGPYKGLTKWERSFVRTPLPGLVNYNMVNRFLNELDQSISYYTRY